MCACQRARFARELTTTERLFGSHERRSDQARALDTRDPCQTFLTSVDDRSSAK